jgi:hypothetical protein
MAFRGLRSAMAAMEAAERIRNGAKKRILTPSSGTHVGAWSPANMVGEQCLKQ